jgi:hypothetical protein
MSELIRRQIEENARRGDALRRQEERRQSRAAVKQGSSLLRWWLRLLLAANILGACMFLGSWGLSEVLAQNSAAYPNGLHTLAFAYRGRPLVYVSPQDLLLCGVLLKGGLVLILVGSLPRLLTLWLIRRRT